MSTRKFKPTSPGRRHMSVSGFDEITASKPHAPLCEPIRRWAAPLPSRTRPQTVRNQPAPALHADEDPERNG